MAKKEEKKQEASGAPGTEAGQEKQVPEKPKKKPSDLKLVPLVMIIGGTVLFMILVIFSLYWFFIRPDIVRGHGADSTSAEVKKEMSKEDEEKAKLKAEMDKLAEMDAIGNTEGVKFVQTADIITNTNPPDWFVVIQLGVEYREPEGGEAKSEEHGEAKGGPTLAPKLMSEISSYVTNSVGAMSIEQLSQRRDSIPTMLTNGLKPIFIQNKMFLRKVTVPKFITQRN